MEIVEDLEFRKVLLKKIEDREFKERTGVHCSDLIYCLVPETLVLQADLTWRAIGELEVGDNLVGINEYPPKPKRRKMLPSQITAKQMRVAPCSKVTFSNGQQVIASNDHPWLVTSPGESPRWMPTSRLLPSWRMAWLSKPWEVEQTWEAGYLAGGFDGEGSSYRCIITFSQNENEMLSRTEEFLSRRGFTYYENYSMLNCVVLQLSGVGNTMRFLGSIRPPRILDRTTWVGRSPWGRMDYKKARIYPISIEPVGSKEVVSIETTSHTYNAEGFWVHNCLNKQALRRLEPQEAKDHDLLLYSLGWATQRWLTGKMEDVPEIEKDGIIVTCDSLVCPECGGTFDA